MGNKLSGSDTRTTTVPGRSRGNRSSTASAPAPTAAATAPAAPTAPAATVSSSGESPSRPERRPRSSSTPVFTTRARRWLQMRRVGSATQGAASPANIFRRSNSGSRGSNGGQSESTERRGLGLRSAGRYVRSRMMPSRSSSVHEGSSRRQRRSFRTMSMLGHRGRENSAVAGAADFVPSVRDGNRFRTTTGGTVWGSALTAAAAAEVAARGRNVPGGLRLAPEGMQQTRCPRCRATLLTPSSVGNFRCPCGVHFSRADAASTGASMFGAPASASGAMPGLTSASGLMVSGMAASRAGRVPIAPIPSQGISTRASTGAGASGLNAQTPRTTASSMSSVSSPSSVLSVASSSSQSLSFSPPLSPSGRSSLLVFGRTSNGLTRRGPFSRTRSGVSTSPSSPLATPSSSSRTNSSTTAVAPAPAPSTAASGTWTRSSSTRRVSTPASSRHGATRLWSGRQMGSLGRSSRTLGGHGGLFSTASTAAATSSRSITSDASGSGTPAPAPPPGIGSTAGPIGGTAATSPVTGTGVERRRRRASAGASGGNHIQVVMCSICGSAGVIQSSDAHANRPMFLCSCGNPVIPATPAQLLAALSRGAGMSQQPRGAPRQLINLLPTMEFKEDSLRCLESEGDGVRQQLRDDDDKISCRVCLSDYEIGDTLRILPCLHKFHQTCIDKWLGRRPLCPLCNTSVDIVYNDPLYSEGARAPSV